MDLLVIDTATEKPQVIFAQGFTLCHVIKLDRAQDLFEAIISLRVEPEAIGVTVGPGSFTGIRVGMAAAKGIAHARQIPLVGVSSLSALISRQLPSFLSLIDARGGGAYILPQRWQGKELISLSPPQKCPIEELPMHLHSVRGIVGPNLSRYNLLNCEEKGSDPAHLVALVMAQLTSNPLPLEPAYFN